MPTQAYRSSGRPEVTFAIERARRQGGGRARHRPDRAAPPQSGARRRRCPTPTRSARATTAAPTRPIWTCVMRIADWPGFAARRAEAEARGRLLGRGLADYVESSIGAPQGARGDHGQARAQGRGRHRHAAERAGARDQLRAGDLRHARRAGRERRHHHGRHRHRQRRRRLAFRPLDAPRRDRVRARRRRSSSRGPSASPPSCSSAAPADVAFADGRFAAPRSNRSFDFLELAEAARACTLARRSRATASRPPPTTRCTSRSSPTAPPRARSRSIPRPARSS